jgi:hypothetical protein
MSTSKKQMRIGYNWGCLESLALMCDWKHLPPDARFEITQPPF